MSLAGLALVLVTSSCRPRPEADEGPPPGSGGLLIGLAGAGRGMVREHVAAPRTPPALLALAVQAAAVLANLAAVRSFNL